MIIFTKHAEKKFKIFERHKLYFTHEQIIEVIKQPDLIDKYSRTPLLVAQKTIDEKHVLRVIYKQEKDRVTIITFYPGRRSQYEKS